MFTHPLIRDLSTANTRLCEFSPFSLTQGEPKCLPIHTDHTAKTIRLSRQLALTKQEFKVAMTSLNSFLRRDYKKTYSVLTVMTVLSKSAKLSVPDVITNVYDETGLLLKPNNAAGILDRLVDAGHATKTKRGKKSSPRTYSLTKQGLHDFGVYAKQGIDMGNYLSEAFKNLIPIDNGNDSDQPSGSDVVTKLRPDIDLPTSTKINPKPSRSWNGGQTSVKPTGRKASIAE